MKTRLTQTMTILGMAISMAMPEARATQLESETISGSGQLAMVGQVIIGESSDTSEEGHTPIVVLAANFPFSIPYDNDGNAVSGVPELNHQALVGYVVGTPQRRRHLIGRIQVAISHSFGHPSIRYEIHRTRDTSSFYVHEVLTFTILDRLTDAPLITLTSDVSEIVDSGH